MKELAALAYRDTTQENRDFWKNEMGNALREIQSAYDEKLETMRGELDSYYNMKVFSQSGYAYECSAMFVGAIYMSKTLTPDRPNPACFSMYLLHALGQLTEFVFIFWSLPLCLGNERVGSIGLQRHHPGEPRLLEERNGKRFARDSGNL